MIQEYQLRILPEIAASEQQLKAYLSQEKGLNQRDITALRTLKRSIDARQRTIYVNLKVRVYLNEMPKDDGSSRLRPNRSAGGQKGMKSIISCVMTDTNYSFGEGGAGAYSDGKLYTRSKKRGNVDKILNVFCQHGASTAILVDAHPHIGTDKLPRVIENMRNTIIECGGEVHFKTRMDALIIEQGEVKGIETNTGETFLGPVILATGHSARDVYRWLAANNVTIEAKGIAVGVRLEHPAGLIDQIQYHNRSGRGKYLPAAEYSFVTQVDGRGVYSFCMCPGGFIVPAASGPEQVVVNGMSPSNRGSRWSNSGMVVEIQPEDIINDKRLTVNNEAEETFPELAVLHFQEELERQCWLQGGRRQTAPAQRMVDFTRKKLSYDLPESSYSPGLISSPLHFWMPEFIAGRLSQGFQQFGRSSHGFLTNEAVMIGVETRTSSPVRIVRHRFMWSTTLSSSPESGKPSCWRETATSSNSPASPYSTSTRQRNSW